MPATAEEARALGAILKGSRVRTGADATEDALLSVHAPRILHIATHGFFLADQAAAAKGSRGLELESPAERAPMRAPAPICTWSAIPTCPPSTAKSSITELPAMPTWDTTTQ